MAPTKENEDPSTNANEEWKKKAPYSIHEDGAGFKVVYEANCHCGRVRYQLNKEKPLASKFCHCTTCQTQHGAPFQWAAIFHKEDINFSHGHHNLEWYDPGEKSIAHKLPCKVRCSFCHSPIMDEGRNMILLFPTLINFKSEAEKRNFEVEMHMFYTHRVVDIPDGKPKWSGLSDDSDLIEDSPESAKKEWEKKKAEKKKEEKKKEKEEEHQDKKQKTDHKQNGENGKNEDGEKGYELRSKD
ncbi:hypothetical protein EJ08DRAFT_592864 [Tothia fuscella]|uniref:CENP-V/GFA domain-containing protein n=1 Tax=Tothia fuscella TaxID=1048955 RepID=A0A9P4NMR5_9PEZI|nr:hypothetical protein EJ08DRAFT_592864 [Tothia fuscella]